MVNSILAVRVGWEYCNAIRYFCLLQGKLPPRLSAQPRLPPVTVEEWERLRDDWGRITEENELRFKARVFYGVR